jgi:hypothetical protein
VCEARREITADPVTLNRTTNTYSKSGVIARKYLKRQPGNGFELNKRRKIVKRVEGWIIPAWSRTARVYRMTLISNLQVLLLKSPYCPGPAPWQNDFGLPTSED